MYGIDLSALWARAVVLALLAGSTGLALLPGNAVASASCPEVGFTIVEPHPSAATRTVRVGENQMLYLRRVPITTTRDIVEIKLLRDDDDGASLLIKFARAAAQRLRDATTHHSGLRIAFMANDEVLLNVVWEGPYGMDTDGTQVSMRHGLKRAQKLVKAIADCNAATASDRPH